MELITCVWKLYRCVEAKEDLLYRFSAAGPVDWGSNQTTGGVPGALCMKVHRDQSTAVTVQSTGYLPESLAVDWGSNQSTGYAQIEAISRLVLWTSRLVDTVGFLERVYDGF